MKKTFAAVVASIALLAGGQAALAENEQVAETETPSTDSTWDITYDYPDNSRWHR